MNERGINNVNVQFNGMINGGLSTEINDHFTVEKDVGGRRDYRAFLTYLNDIKITI